MTMKLVLTKHAQDAMIERGVTVEMVEQAIIKGSKVKQTDGLLATYSYVRVAYKVINDVYVVKTVFVEGGK